MQRGIIYAALCRLRSLQHRIQEEIKLILSVKHSKHAGDGAGQNRGHPDAAGFAVNEGRYARCDRHTCGKSPDTLCIHAHSPEEVAVGSPVVGTLEMPFHCDDQRDHSGTDQDVDYHGNDGVQSLVSGRGQTADHVHVNGKWNKDNDENDQVRKVSRDLGDVNVFDAEEPCIEISTCDIQHELHVSKSNADGDRCYQKSGKDDTERCTDFRTAGDIFVKSIRKHSEVGEAVAALFAAGDHEDYQTDQADDRQSQHYAKTEIRVTHMEARVL